jgi:hypothetical protein
LAFEVARAAGAGIDDQKNPGISSICKADFSKQITNAASYQVINPKIHRSASPTLRGGI